VTLEAAEPVEVVGDRARLRQVLDNLLSNVRAHTPAGTNATVRIAADDTHAVIEVSDNGPGMSAEQAARAFERFYRADPSRSRLHGGAGLGLAIVAAIVETHGGGVDATSAAGGGATFTARLPLAGPPPEPPTPTEEVQPEEGHPDQSRPSVTEGELRSPPGESPSGQPRSAGSRPG
jgi:two-component system OmpR family sensor kinase